MEQTMRWILPAEDPRLAQTLANELSLHPVCARVLVARGYSTPEAASALLRDRLADLPDPSGLLGMARAVERIVRAVREGEAVTLYGDYDVDGVTASAIVALFLRSVGARVSTYIPLRMEEGYGLNAEAIDRIAADGTRLLVALDCGISALSEAERAAALGIDLVVVDHHQPGAELPRAVAVLDPHQPGCTFPGKELCAAGLAFFLVVALRRALREGGFFAGRPEPNLREYLDLAALGTIADVVPLVGVNRILVKHGLDKIAKARRPGVRALKLVSGLAADATLTAGQVAFRLAPKINAAGRLADASAGVELLTTTDQARATALATELEAANSERQAIEKRIVDEAIAQAEKLGGEKARGLVLAGEGWHPGVIGIVASRVVERFHRPAFVIGIDGDEGRGSGRSIEGFHLFRALEACAPLLVRYGGHSHAAGLTIAADRIEEFRQRFDALARERIAEADLVARCRIDAVLATQEIDLPLAESLARLAPFGAGNPEPVLAALKLRAHPRLLPAKNGGDGHLKLSIEGARHLDVIGFGFGPQAALASGPIDMAFHLGVDEWNGTRRTSLRLKSLTQAGH
ncbi:MAG: single-stranded-DNA-specific exonuclease RecJ [Myxococcales bacterium]|jgi:single-stranded-DNA-specific exonuclease